MKRTTLGWMAVAALTAGAGLSMAVLRARPADAACCYFAAQEKDINQPAQKAFITWDEASKIESFTVQPKFEGNALDFGMVIPTPGQPKLDEMPRDFFKDLAIYSILMPLPSPIYVDGMGRRYRAGSAPGVYDAMGVGAGSGGARRGVNVLEAGVVGSLDYKVITAEDAGGLFLWLKENNYSYGGDESTLDFYISKKWFFTVMKIDSKQMKKNSDGSYLGEITPTRFTFASDKCIYPLKITQLSVKDRTDALFYVQAATQMDLEGDLSWMHSWRVMYLTYVLGCGANEQQQQELVSRQAWVAEKKKKDPKFDTTKLEWARKLGEADMRVLEDPATHYAQMAGGDLPPGAEEVSLETFLKDVKDKHTPKETEEQEAFREHLKSFEKSYTATRGTIVRVETVSRFLPTKYMWLPNREAPAEDVKGLARLKGHLQKGQWVTKFRKVLRKDEMTDDLVLVPVPAGQEQEYLRIMPTSPP